MRRIGVVLALVALAACGQSDYERFKASYDIGYQDGYGVAYVNTCRGGKFAVSEGIDEPGYRDGYQDGHKQGQLECKLEVEG